MFLRWSLNDTKDLFQIFAWIAAALFFGYKALTGYFNTDLSMALVAKRTQVPDAIGADYITATLTVKKGERGGIELHDVRLGIFDLAGGLVDERKFESIHRYPYSGSDRTFALNLHEPNPDPIMLFSPGDEMQFCAVYKTTKREPFVLSAAVLGRRIFLKKNLTRRLPFRYLSQWHASVVVLPNS